MKIKFGTPIARQDLFLFFRCEASLCSGRIQELWMLTNLFVLSSGVLLPKDFKLLLLEEGADDYQ